MDLGLDIKEKKEHNIISTLVIADKISCTDINLPYISLELVHRNQFYIRSFAHYLGNELKSCAHITSIERTSQGIYSQEDALVSYEWSWSNIQKAIELKHSLLSEYCNRMKNQIK
ncbi:probable tRNA pseudouridine synthase 1 [Centruroides sculpturatus]|uniref:probable tRNA pseudouridine synthase 1 n=1 Tax=Centruroides sculpturatus TaxID=218467 RepID=UPI000C6EA670|nr:probable tRNA pseudouridine synthase 1 [Centruroides sculpturatus]